MERGLDPRIAKGLARTRRAYETAEATWRRQTTEDDELDDLPRLASDALAHLDAGRWEDAVALCEEIFSLESTGACAAIWTPFALAASEAAQVAIAVG